MGRVMQIPQVELIITLIGKLFYCFLKNDSIVIHYNFIGVLDTPEVEEFPDNVVLDSRQGVAVEYLVGKAG